MHRDYRSKGVKFYFIYKSLAHPEHNGYVHPLTKEERLKHVAEAKRTLGGTIPWIVDAMDNRLKTALGDRPNSEFVIDPKGTIVRKRAWSDPVVLRKDLESLVGRIDRPTRVSDIKLNVDPRPKAAASGVVPRISVPRTFRALKVQAVEDGGSPFYVKLRAEAAPSLVTSGKGELYLGFFLDPLYDVHWNNLVDAIEVTLDAPTGVAVNQRVLNGPKVKQPADIDPREFLVQVSGVDSAKPLHLTVSYFACNDKEGWCKQVTQKFLVEWSADRHAGRPMRGRNRPLAPSRDRTGNSSAEENKRTTGGSDSAVVFGIVRSMNRPSRTLSIEGLQGGTTTMKLTPDTGVQFSDDRSRLREIRNGDRVRIRTITSADGTFTAIDVRVL